MIKDGKIYYDTVLTYRELLCAMCDAVSRIRDGFKVKILCINPKREQVVKVIKIETTEEHEDINSQIKKLKEFELLFK